MSEPNEVTPTWRAAIAAAAKQGGHNLTPAALNELAQTLGLQPLNRYYGLYADSVPAQIASEVVAAALATAKPTPAQTAGPHDDTCGVPPELWARMSSTNRLIAAREFEKSKAQSASNASSPQQPQSGFREKRIQAELHGSYLRMTSLSGSAREEAAKRVLALQEELKSLKG